MSGSLCVLGGTGFLGRRFLGRVIRQGYRVRVPTRNRARHRDLLVFPGLELAPADVHDEQQLRRLVQGCDAVVNLVGILNEGAHDGSGFRRAHVDLAAKLVRACQENGVARLLHVSALKANAERGPSHYLRTKGQAEQVIKSQSGDTLHYTLFRPAPIFGPGDSLTNRFARLLRRLPVLPLPCPDARMAPVFVDDVAQALVAALHDGRTYDRSYELCGPDIYSLAELVKFIQRLLGIHRAIVPLPKPLGRLQAWVGDYLLPGKPFSLDNFKSLGVSAVCTENGLAALGIQASSLATVAPAYLHPRREPTALRQLPS